ncbi:MAG TPA: MFS transporter [Rhizomicrobium sp.]
MLRPDRVEGSAGRVGLFQLISFVLPAVGIAAVGMPLVVHLPQFYASKEVGLSLVVTGSVFTLMRLLDVIIDPIAGYVSDRWTTRWGRRRPMLLIGAPLLAIGAWQVFVPGGPVSAVHLGFWLFVMYLGYSMCVIPHLSWGSEISPDYHERSRVFGWMQAFTVAGMMGVLLLPAILEANGVQRHSTQIMAMAIFTIVTLVIGVGLCVAVVPEPEIKLKTSAPFWPTLKFMLRNRAMLTVMAVDFLESVNQGARGATFFFFASIAIGLPKAANSILLLYFLVGVACIPLWMAVSRRIGKHKTLIASFVYGLCVAPLLLIIPSGNLWIAGTVLLLSGVPYGAPAFLIRSMMADVADADTAENNAERAGLMYSFLSLTSKFGIGLSVFVTFTALSLIGFDPKAAHFAPDLPMHLRIVYVAIPMIFNVVSLIAVLGYPIDERKQRELRDEIERRRLGEPPGILEGDGVVETAASETALAAERTAQ